MVPHFKKLATGLFAHMDCDSVRNLSRPQLPKAGTERDYPRN